MIGRVTPKIHDFISGDLTEPGEELGFASLGKPCSPFQDFKEHLRGDLLCDVHRNKLGRESVQRWVVQAVKRLERVTLALCHAA